jgi:hypothetical protein
MTIIDVLRVGALGPKETPVQICTFLFVIHVPCIRRISINDEGNIEGYLAPTRFYARLTLSGMSASGK